MAGARKSKRRNSKLRNKTRRQRGGGGGLLSPEEKKRIMDRVAGIPSYNTYQAAAAKKPWWKPWGRQ